MNYIGLDVHKKECQAAILDKDGELVKEMRIQTAEEGFKHLLKAIDKGSSMVMEASSSFYVPHDFFRKAGLEVKIAHPKKLRAIASAKIKNDKIDAKTLAGLLRADMIPECYIPDRDIRELRELITHRLGLVKMCTESKNRIHALLTRRGIKHPFSDLFGKGGRAWLDSIKLEPRAKLELEQNLENIDLLTKQISAIEKEIFAFEKTYPEARLAQTMVGVGRIISLTFLAGVADISRFPDEKKLANYAGLIPGLHQSGDVKRHGRITKEGSKLIRTAMVQAANVAIKSDTKIKRFYERMLKRHTKNQAKVAVARKMLTWLYFMLKRGEAFSA